MKRLLFLIALLIGGYVIFTIPASHAGRSISGSNIPYSSISPTIASSPDPVEIPTLLSIPKLNIHTKVEQVGLDAKGNMDVPKDSDNVGWYELGYRPGQKGSAVLAGHFDKVTGSPAVFYHLNELTEGDKIMVTQTNGRTATFKVIDNKSYEYNILPLQAIFASTDQPRLNLITCDGTFDQVNKNYSKRTVVYAVLDK